MNEENDSMPIITVNKWLVDELGDEFEEPKLTMRGVLWILTSMLVEDDLMDLI